MAKLRTNLHRIGVAAACCTVLPPAAASAELSPWAKSAHSAARLVPAGTAEGYLLAGVEVRLDPEFITYWRSPGDAGVPPTFQFSGSGNVKQAEVKYPAPGKFDEAGFQAFGYSGHVTFPVLVTAQNPARPVRLDLTFDYAVCANICLPAQAHLTVVLDGSSSAGEAVVRDALAAVPRRRMLGEAGPLRVDAVRPEAVGRFVAEASTPEGTGTLFGEAPEPWFLSVSGDGRPDSGGHLHFGLTLSGGPGGSGAVPSEPIRLTLVGRAGAIEVPVRLDEPNAKP